MKSPEALRMMQLEALARVIDEIFNPSSPRIEPGAKSGQPGEAAPKAGLARVGFFLAIFPAEDPGRFSYAAGPDGFDFADALKRVADLIEEPALACGHDECE